jgi:predicted ATPase/DNA-binding winged helix-turn-helix (wHTH) protein
MNGRAISFGPFRLLAEQRMLLEGDKPVRLGSRAFDILAALTERAGEVVGKEELMARAWPQTFVEEANLKIQISALRRALGDGQGGHRYVVTVVGRGYNFVAPVRIDELSRSLPPATVPSTAAHNLPLAVARMIGRAEAVDGLVARLSRQRLVTIVGPGGIGKTTTALAVAERMITEYGHGVWLIDLASIGDARLVPSAIATVLDLQIPAENPIHGLVAAVRDHRMLLFLDSCEHVIDEVASLATALLSGTKDVDILATSREPLRVAGENEYRLGPLGSPSAPSRLTAAEAVAFPAVQLFVERVTAIVEDFELTDENVPLVLELCRGLDGLPLAIEFAAPGVGVLGLEGLVARLKDSLPLLGSRRRGRVPRHRTMRAVIDWSYGLLGEDEQLFFRTLGIFSGGFTVEAAAAVAKESATIGCEAIDRLADLVAKSLVVADVSGTKPRFRLLETTRAFAIEKLDESGNGQPVAHRHAAYYRQLFERAAAEAPVRATSDWLADYTQDIDNLRAALDWAFSPGGEASTGVALTAAALPLWIRLSLLEECCRRARQALGVAPTENLREAMQLEAALGASTPESSEMVAAFTKVLDMARRLEDVEYQLRGLWGLYYYYTGIGRFRTAQPFALEFHSLSLRGSDQNDQMFGKSMVAVAEHFVGDQGSARSQLEQLLTQDAAADLGRDLVRFRYVVRFGMDFRLQVTVFLARVLWLQGFADQAVRMAEQSLQEADATGHATSRCFVLALASCPISFWVGDGVAAAKYTAKLVELSRQHVLPHWAAFGARFEQVLVVKTDDLDGGSRRRPGGQDEVAAPNFSFRSLSGLTQLAEALGQAGRTTEGLAALEANVGKFEDGCFSPELIRLKGELSIQQDMPGAAELAEALFRQALDGAREQGALSWELRAATSLARLLRNQGRPADAIACLRPIYDRFTEGFGTVDLVAAKQILDQASDPGTIR